MKQGATTAQDIRITGVLMLAVTVVASAYNVSLLAAGEGSVVVTAMTGVMLGVAVYVVGEIEGETA